MKMNLPNKLTILRMVLVPVFVAVFYITAIPYNFIISAGIFLIASLTDFLDGKIARKYNMVTNFGKFLDPIADKILVATALIAMIVPPEGVVITKWYAVFFVMVIIARELLISGFRLIGANKGMVISADMAGKIKTFVTDISILVLLVGAQITPETFDLVNIIGTVLLGISTLLTVVSLIECFAKNKTVLKDN